MKQFRILLLLIFFISACDPLKGKNTLAECNWNFGADMLRGVEYKECDKDALIKDFEDYIAYLDELQKAGELWREEVINGIPHDVKIAKRVFCSHGCSATHWINGQCFRWQDPKRPSFQRIERKAKEEAREKPYCEKAYKAMAERNKKEERLDYDWKNTKKYRDWIGKKEFPKDGETIWESL